MKLEDDPESSDDAASSNGFTDQHEKSRLIYVNNVQPIKYASNAVTTAKYNIFTFLPRFLFEQFRKYSNCFFLFITLLQQIPDVSPTGRYTTLVPLTIILLISAVKEIIEDIKRHYADKQVNNRNVKVFQNGDWCIVKWRDLQVGNIVNIPNNSYFPADLIILSSSEPKSMCYIETANLDGETNLKIRQGIPQTAHLLESSAINSYHVTIECEQPNRHLYEFVGNLNQVDNHSVPLGPDQLLLRGAKLMNTNWIYGVVIYTGFDTKLMKNAMSTPLKMSTIDRITNKQILFLFAMLICMSVLSALASELWMNKHITADWYLGIDDICSDWWNYYYLYHTSPSIPLPPMCHKPLFIPVLEDFVSDMNEFSSPTLGYSLLTFIILYNNLIPISLQVTLEMVRFIQAYFINVDEDMYYDVTNTYASARTSNLNEELGQVKYLFTDKTGTLTCNIMKFKKCSIAGNYFDISNAESTEELLYLLTSTDKASYFARDFLLLLALCHTVIPETNSDIENLIYRAASPDERALVIAARNLGYVFVSRGPDTITINEMGEYKKYNILNVLEFTSERKRMSVIVRNPDGIIKLYCKGADSVICERLNDKQNYKNITLQHLELFASEGLRTLCCAVTVIPPDVYEAWSIKYNEAILALRSRQERINKIADTIEYNLELLGATAIEDQLQEGVPDTIFSLMQAGIKIWMLTGDKSETAINIAYSCKLLVSGMQIVYIQENVRDAINQQLIELGKPAVVKNGCSLIIDGKSLKHALSPDLRHDFLNLCIFCKSVICSRVSPFQKAEIVELIRHETGSVTLAIGDGANDVAMIQRSHVGVGISGLEGLQAARASDYSIAQFRYLKKLLLVHGAWSYSRICKMVLYCFYKNVCLYVIELWYAMISGWSGITLFERWTIGLFNVLFTAAPPFAMGLFDQVCSQETMLSYPLLYKPCQESQHFNVHVFWLWITYGLVHSFLLFWFPLLAMHQDISWEHGYDGGYLILGNMIYTYVVVVVCLKAGLEISSWTSLAHIAIWGSICFWFIFLTVYTNIWPTFPVAANMLGLGFMILTSLIFWFGLLIFPCITLLPDICLKTIKNTVKKSLTDAVREAETRKCDPGTIIPSSSRNRFNETARLLKNVFRRTNTQRANDLELTHGYAFSQEEGGAVSQSELIRAYASNAS